MSIHNLSIGKRSSLIAGSGIGAAIIIGALSISQIMSINRSEMMLAEDALPSLEIINNLNDDLNNLRVAELQFATASTEAQTKQLATDSADYRTRIAGHIEKYAKRVDDADERGAFDKLKDQIATYQANFDKTIAQVSGDPASRDAALLGAQLSASDKAFGETGNRIDGLLKYNNNEVAKSHGRAQSSYGTALRLIVIALLLAGVVSIALTVWIIRGLKREMGGEPRDVGGIARRIAAGDLTVVVNMAAGDTSSVMFAMKEMRDNLLAIVRTVRNGVETISTASTEIAAGNQDLSSRTEQQASSLQETASSMEQLTATVKQNADNAQQASRLAAAASDIAQNGGAVVSQVVEKMGAINNSSQKIADIIGVIDGIAFQTNILALNAAVEAARAGEQGRGFAVVATEVRSLAQRSAQAAKEVKILINDSVEQVGAGNKLVAQAGSTMADIVDSIGRVAAIMGEITAASDEQSTGIGQVNLAISQMDQVTQQNAALVEQAAAAAESMQEQAGGLAQAVDVFKTGEAAAVARPPVPRPAKRRPALAL